MESVWNVTLSSESATFAEAEAVTVVRATGDQEKSGNGRGVWNVILQVAVAAIVASCVVYVDRILFVVLYKR
jgi:hypothetical protein